MDSLVERLPNILDKLFKSELMRQWKRSTPMDAEEFRMNLIANIHYNIGPEAFEKYSIGIWDILALNEADMMDNYEYGDKIFRCIHESDIPIYSSLVVRKLSDIEYCRSIVENIPNVTDYVLDKLVEFDKHSDIAHVFEMVRSHNMSNNNFLKVCSTFENSIQEDMLIEIFMTYISESFEAPLIVEFLEELSNIRDVEESAILILNEVLMDQIKTCLSYLEYSNGNYDTIDSIIFAIEINIITELQELADLSYDVQALLGSNKSMIYNMAHLMSRFIEGESLAFVVELLRKKFKHKVVKEIVANLVKRYVTNTWFD